MFTMSFIILAGAGTPTGPPASRVQQLLDEHRPWEMVENMVLIIMHQTHAALLEILGLEAPAPSPSFDGHIQVSRPVDPADPGSPLLIVNASATHCFISLTMDSLHGGGGATPADYKDVSPPKQENWRRRQYRLARTTVTASPGTLHLARVDGGGPGGHWTCADVQPDVSGKGLFGVLELIKARLDAAIRLESSLLRIAKNSGCRGPKVREVDDVRSALERMRAAADLDAIMRRRRCCRERRRPPIIQEESVRRPDVDVDQAADDAEELVKRLSALHVGQKRGRRGEEMNSRLELDDDAELLAKRLKALHV